MAMFLHSDIEFGEQWGQNPRTLVTFSARNIKIVWID